MAKSRWHMALLLSVLLIPTISQAQVENGDEGKSSGNGGAVQMLRKEVDELRTSLGEYQRALASQEKKIDALREEGRNTPIYAALGVVAAALIAGLFALRNQNHQASQERLLKAIDLIMQSNSGYQAEIRRRNLEVFLDPETNRKLQDIEHNFSGSEFTELRVALAQAMSDKVASPDEVLNIWDGLLEKKGFVKTKTSA